MDTNTYCTDNDPDKEQSNISRPSILLWKPASSLSDHDCEKIFCTYENITECSCIFLKYTHASQNVYILTS